MKDYIGQIIGIAVFTIVERFISKMIERNKKLKSNSVTQLASNLIRRKEL